MHGQVRERGFEVANRIRPEAGWIRHEPQVRLNGSSDLIEILDARSVAVDDDRLHHRSHARGKETESGRASPGSLPRQCQRAAVLCTCGTRSRRFRQFRLTGSRNRAWRDLHFQARDRWGNARFGRLALQELTELNSLPFFSARRFFLALHRRCILCPTKSGLGAGCKTGHFWIGCRSLSLSPGCSSRSRGIIVRQTAMEARPLGRRKGSRHQNTRVRFRTIHR
jgi:hypothetical protein